MNGLAFPDLDQLDLAFVLRTHIISDNGRFLIPVKLLAQLNLDPIRAKLTIPYVHNPEVSEEVAVVTKPEMMRLHGHSLLTQIHQGLYKLHNNLDSASEFEVKIRQLRDAFDESSARVLGDKAEEVAGEKIYPKLIKFKEYFDELSNSVKKTIPQVVLEEVENFLAIISDQRNFLRFSTCLNIRRNHLDNALNKGYGRNSSGHQLINTRQLFLEKQFELYDYGEYETTYNSMATGDLDQTTINVQGTERDCLVLTSAVINNTDCQAIVLRGDNALNFRALPEILLDVTEQEKDLFLEKIKPLLKQAIQSVESFSVFTQELQDQDLQNKIFKLTIGENIVGLINTHADYKTVERFIENQALFIATLKEKYPVDYLVILYRDFIVKIIIDLQKSFNFHFLKGKKEHEITLLCSSLIKVDIDSISINEPLIELFHYHPWLEYSPNNIIITAYVKFYMYKKLFNTMPEYNKEKAFNLDENFKSIKKNYLDMIGLNINSTDIALLFPYVARELFFTNEHKYPMFNPEAPVTSFALTPVDLLRILAANKLSCRNKKPVILMLKQLENIKIEKLDSFNSVILNIATEDQPLWILLERIIEEGNNSISPWRATYPRELVDEDSLKNIKNKFNYSVNNIALNSVNNDIYHRRVDVSLKLQWHAIMCAVLVKAYKPEMPVSLLVQKMILDSIRNQDDSTAYSTDMHNSVYQRLNRVLYPEINLVALGDRYTHASIINDVIHYLEYAHEFPLINNNTCLKCPELSDSYESIGLYAVYYLIYTQSTITELKLLKITAEFSERTQKLIDQDFRIEKYAYDSDEYSYAQIVAARNRFLKKNFNGNLSTVPRDGLWKQAAKLMLEYFQNNTHPDTDIAEMGYPGLCSFFSYLVNDLSILEYMPEGRPVIKLNLNIKLHLFGKDRALEKIYLNRLADFLFAYTNREYCDGLCVEQFRIFLPDIFLSKEKQVSIEQGLVNVICKYNELQEKHNSSTETVFVYSKQSFSDDFYADLLSKTKEKNFSVMLDFPEEASNHALNLLHEIQNEILNNQRNQRVLNIERFKLSIEDSKNIAPEIILMPKDQASDPGWMGNDVTYFLSDEIVGYQQQQQHMLQQQHIHSEKKTVEEKAIDGAIDITAIFKSQNTPLMPAKKIYGDRRQIILDDNASAYKHKLLEIFDGKDFSNVHLQLFNEYGDKGLEYYSLMMQKIASEFSQAVLPLWEKYYFNKLENGAEVLADREIKAILLSITTLKNNKPEQAIWWLLLQMQCESCAYVNYADLWYPFQAFLSYIDARGLVLSAEQFEKYCHLGHQEITALQLMERIYTVVKLLSGQVDSHAICQSILANLSLIDWRENGFCFAVKHAGYQYWDQDLQLNQDSLPFSVSLKCENEIGDQYRDLLRFAASRAQLSYSDFQKFKQLIQLAINADNSNMLELRIFCACITIGVDSFNIINLSDLVNTQKFTQLQQQLLNWLNQLFDLSENRILEKSEWQLCYADIARFIAELEQYPELTNAVFNYNKANTKLFVNASGLVLQSPILNFSEWLKNINQNIAILSNAQLLQFPFLINNLSDLDQEIEPKFSRQLSSINYAETTWFPDVKTIILANQKNVSERRETIAEWIEQGCKITRQEARFRPLLEPEAAQILAEFKRKISIVYRDQNLRLCEELVSQYLAIEDPSQNKHQIENFIQQIIALDNKPHYNELGQVLGLILQKAKQASVEEKHFISIPQLTSWLDILCHKELFNTHHFPVVLLDIVMLTEFSASLINANLHFLRGFIQQKFQKNIIELIKSKLPLKAKQLLIRLVLARKAEKLDLIKPILNRLHSNTGNDQYQDDFIELVYQFIEKEVFGEVDSVFSDKLFTDICLANQENLISLYLSGDLNPEKLEYILEKTPYLAKVLTSPIDFSQIEAIFNYLNSWPDAQQAALYNYLEQPPYITVDVLYKLLENSQETFSKKNAYSLITHFETVIQAQDANGNSKRTYSISPEETKELYRVLNQIQLNTETCLAQSMQQYLLDLLRYANAFSQADELETRNLNTNTVSILENIDRDVSAINSGLGDESNQVHLSMVRVLSCLREALLRKTGVWANHTQMLVLIYAAVYENHNILYEIFPGEGKSTVARMRHAYMAIRGYVVDALSIKESLCKRDYLDSKPFYDALGIYSAFITPDSSELSYRTYQVENNIKQAVHFSTPGLFALFFLRHGYQNRLDGLLKRADRNDKNHYALYLDEVDSLLLDDDTQINYSSAGSELDSYNYDAWVYQAVYEYYCQHKESFYTNANTGAVSVSRLTHLRVLAEYIMKRSVNAPKESSFIKDYISPAYTNNSDALIKRDQQLRYLLTACHKACLLKSLRDYCVESETRTIKLGDETIELNIRVPRVVINKEIKEGAAYSELVDQFLNTRLNNEAASKGEPTDFFINPVSNIVASLNMRFMAKNFYAKREGGSATLGSENERQDFLTDFGFNQIVKFPLHQPSQKVILPTVFCHCSENYINTIAEKIIEYYQQSPILIACEDDLMVKQLYDKVNKYFYTKNIDIIFYADTNDSGKKEHEVIPLVEKNKHVIFSARMGIGTNILPESEDGLVLIRTYPAHSRLREQEFGRPARYGAKGICIEVIDFSQIEKEVNCFESSLSYSEQFNVAYQNKLKSFDNTVDVIYSELLAKMQAVADFKFYLKKEKNCFVQKKNNYIASLSMGFILAIQTRTDEQVKIQWRKMLEKIEAQWLLAQPVDSIKDFFRFIGESDKVLTSFFENELLDQKCFSAVNWGEKKFQPMVGKDPVLLGLEGKIVLNTDASTLRNDFNRLAFEKNLFFQKWKKQSDFYCQLISINQRCSPDLVLKLHETLLFILHSKHFQKAQEDFLIDIIKPVLHEDINRFLYLDCVQFIFSKDFYSDTQATDAAGNILIALERLSFFLKIIVNINLDVYEADTNHCDYLIRAKSFINSVANAITSYDQPSLSYMTAVIDMMDSVVLKLLMMLEDTGDISVCIDLLALAECNVERLDLFAIIKHNRDYIAKQPRILVYMHKVVASYAYENKGKDFKSEFPPVQLSETLDPELNMALWEFFSNRVTGLDKTACLNFTNGFEKYLQFCLKRQQETETSSASILLQMEKSFRERLVSQHMPDEQVLSIMSCFSQSAEQVSQSSKALVFTKAKQQLKLIPPYISIQYILNSACKESFKHEEMFVDRSIIELAEFVNTFLYQHKAISSQYSYALPVDKEKFNKISSLVYSFSPSSSMIFFTMINNQRYRSLPTDVLAVLLEWYFSTQSLNESIKLERWCDLAVNLFLLPKENYEYLLQFFIANNFEKLNVFVTCLLSNNFKSIPVEYVRSIWDAFDRDVLEMSLELVFTALMLACNLNAKKNWLDYFGSIDSHAQYRQLILCCLNLSYFKLSHDFKTEFNYQHQLLIKKSILNGGDEGFAKAMQEINLLPIRIDSDYSFHNIKLLHANISIDLLQPLLDYELSLRIKLSLPKAVHSVHWLNRYNQVKHLLNAFGRVFSDDNKFLFLSDNKLLDVLSEICFFVENFFSYCDEILVPDSKPKENYQLKTLYVLVFDLYFACCKRFLTNADPLLFQSGIVTSFSQLLDLLRSFISNKYEYIEMPLIQHVTKTIHFLENLVYRKPLDGRLIILGDNGTDLLSLRNENIIPVESCELGSRFDIANLTRSQKLQALQLLENIQRFSNDETRSYLRNIFDECSIEDVINPYGVFTIFVAVLTKHSQLLPLPIGAIKSSWQYYQKNSGAIDLKQMVYTLIKAFELYQNPNDAQLWLSYFSHYKLAKPLRVNILIAVNQGWLNLGDEFTKLIYSRYSEMILFALNTVCNIQKTKMIISFAREFKIITDAAFSGIDLPTAALIVPTGPAFVSSPGMFSRQLEAEKMFCNAESYNFHLSNSPSLKMISASFFSALDAISELKVAINNILEQQAALLNPRLPVLSKKKLAFYQVTQRLFEALIAQGLSDPGIPTMDKATIEGAIGTQLITHLNSLKERLPKSHAVLKNLITHLLNKCSDEYNSEQQIYVDIITKGIIEIAHIHSYLAQPVNQLPVELQYLVNTMRPILEGIVEQSQISDVGLAVIV